MKKKIKVLIPLCMMIICAVGILSAVSAASLHGSVDFDGDKVNVNYAPVEFKKQLTSMVPGQEVKLDIDVENKSIKMVDWYVESSVLKTFEDGAKASGGSYEYEMIYTDSEGKKDVIYSSENVGGEDSQGLKEATNGTEEYFYLTRMKPGEKGVFTTRVALDGETVTNDYQLTLADININFAVDVVDKNDNIGKTDDSDSSTATKDTDQNSTSSSGDKVTGSKVEKKSKDSKIQSPKHDLRLNDLVKTGDHTKLMIYILLFAVSAAALMAVLISMRNTKGGSNEENI